MLLCKIGEEFEELINLLGNEQLFLGYYGLYKATEYKNRLLSWGADMRKLARMETILKKKKFESKAVQTLVDTYLERIWNIFDNYDILTQNILDNKDEGTKKVKDETALLIDSLAASIAKLHETLSNIEMASDVVSTIINDTWEPLPDDKKEVSVNNIIVSSETRSMSLNDIANDVKNLDQFFNNICLLIDKDKNENDNIYLRKIETGSLTVAVSCVIAIAPMVKFMFWCIKLCQDTAGRSLDLEKKKLDNEEKRLKIINDNIERAKEILEIKPDNKEADEVIQRCAVYLLEFLENNPAGTINGEHYDIGMEKLKIEEKEKEK